MNMKHIVVVLFVSLSGVSPAFAYTKNDCKLEVVLTPRPLGMGPRNKSHVDEALKRAAQGVVDAYNDFYDMGGKRGIAYHSRMMVELDILSIEAAINIAIGYIACELQ